MQRREFITVLGGAAVAWPLPSGAQQPLMPVIGFLHSASSQYMEGFGPAVRQGLNATGYNEGQNVVVEYRAAEGQYDRLPGLVAVLR